MTESERHRAAAAGKGPEYEETGLLDLDAPQPQGIETGPLIGGPDPGAAGATATAAAGDTLREAGLWSDAWRQLRKNPLFLIPAIVILVFCVMAVRPQLFTDLDPRDCDLAHSVERSSEGHPFGYDVQGCDYLARVVHGARVSLVVGMTTVIFASAIAILLGCLAGFYGGWWDAVIARVTDIWYAVPYLLFAIVALNFLQEKGLLQVTIVLILLFWPTMMRLMRSSVLGIKELEYVQAARALGAGNMRILLRHIVPNGIAPVIVYATITVGIVIGVEAVLSFLGVGLQLPAISWGLMISAAQARILSTPHLLLYPGLFLSILVLSFILLGDALREALDPRLR